MLMIVSPIVSDRAAPPDQLDPLVNSLFVRLTVEQRIGQLMLVTFRGSSVDSSSEIASLIRDYRVGGVMVLAANHNIAWQTNPPANGQTIIQQLQPINFYTTTG